MYLMVVELLWHVEHEPVIGYIMWKNGIICEIAFIHLSKTFSEDVGKRSLEAVENWLNIKVKGCQEIQIVLDQRHLLK